MVKALEESVNACWVNFVEIASKMKIDFSIAFFIFFTKYLVVGVQLTHSSLGYRDDIIMFHFITIIMSKISIFPGSKSLFLDIWFYYRIISVTSYKSQRSCFVSPLLNRGRWREQTIGLIMTWRSYSFVCTSHYLMHYHYADLSESIVHISLVTYTLCVSDLVHSFNHLLTNIICCVISSNLFLLIIVRMFVLYRIINIKSEIWIPSRCLVLVHSIMVCAICFAMLETTSTFIMQECNMIKVICNRSGLLRTPHVKI